MRDRKKGGGEEVLGEKLDYQKVKLLFFSGRLLSMKKFTNPKEPY